MGNKMNRKGIELSINFLVILIISIIIFSFGVAFVFNLWKNLPHPSDAPQINLCDGNNEKICVEKNNIQLNYNKPEIIKIQLDNVLDRNSDFEINLEKNGWFDKNKILHDEDYNITIMPMKETKRILSNEKGEFTIAFIANQPVKSGTYVVDIKFIISDNKQYGNTQKVYLSVN